jgi:hypothetical protein
MGGDSPRAQQAACSGLRGGGRVKRADGHGNRGRIKIQEDQSPKTTLQVRNFALTPLALTPLAPPGARDLKLPW